MNKRIQKKKDKERLVQAIISLSREDFPQSQRIAIRRLRNTPLPALSRLGMHLLQEWMRWHNPLRRMTPRMAWTGELVQWRQSISDVRERL